MNKIFEKIRFMKNYIFQKFKFFKNCILYLIYYQPSKAALNYIENYISIDNFLEGLSERWSETTLIEYYHKLENNDLNIYDCDNQLIDLVHENLVDGNYTSLMILLMANSKIKIPDYYKFYLLVKNNQLLKEKLFENQNFRKHIIKYLEKNKNKYNDNISFKIKYYKNGMNLFDSNNNLLNNENKSCMSCYEDIHYSYFTKCKKCKAEMDLVCMNEWLRMDKNTCIICRTYLLNENEYYNLILLQKYLDYLIISNELKLNRFYEFPT